YPWLRGVCWIGANGQQAIKWTVRDQITPLITVGWREYFRAVAEDRAWRTKMPGLPKGFYLQPVFSSNTGENFMTLSMAPANLPGVVAAMDFHPLSLMN